jgi:flagellar basal-body rod protein FlgB
MFIDRMLNGLGTPVLERVLDFTSARHKLIVDNIANVDTPDYRQHDLSVDKFMKVMRERIEQSRDAAPGSTRYDDIDAQIEHPDSGMLSHDGNNRSMEELQSNLAKNALLHNMIVEMLRKQFQTMELALKDKPV